MAFSDGRHDYSIKSKEKVHCIKEAEAEECLKIMNSRAKKEAKFTEKLEGLYDDMEELCVKDLVKTDQKSNFNFEPQFNTFSARNIISQIETNSVVIIKGPTGCGKTTQIPQLILNTCIKKRLNCNIIVTQPRRIAAINIAKRVCQEGGWPLGSLVGYKVGMQKEVSSETRLTFCTTEILLYNLVYQKHMFNFTHIILDEIHERDQNLDFLLLIIKKLLQTNSRQVKVILMSATISETRFAKYFSSPVGNNLVPAPTIKMEDKRAFEIRTYYLDELDNLGMIPEVFANEPKLSDGMINFCSLIIKALDKIDENDKEEGSDSFVRHAVLIFLPGIYEIEELYNCLSSVYHGEKLWDLLILHSTISNEEQNLIFLKPPKGHRRIILSTNIAESSITVPDVKYVIDFCLVKRLKVDPVTHYESLELNWASKANCEQRAGRTGRVMDGRVYRLIPKAFYDNILNDESTPEIVHAPLANVVLRAKIFDFGEPRELLSLSLDPPPLFNLATTIMTLKEVGALVNEGDTFQPYNGRLTDLGRIMAFLPVNIRISKLIMLGHVFGVLRDAIILGASMTVKDVFNEQYYPNMSSYINRRKWARNIDSDCIAVLNVYKTWQNEKANRRLSCYRAESQWAQRNGVQLKVLHELHIMVNEITYRLKQLDITESVGVNKVVWQDMDRDFVLQVILAGAFYPNYFIKRTQNVEDFKENITRCLNTTDPMKTVYVRGWPVNQPGYLYAQEIQKIFAKHQGIPEKQIAVFFDKSTRVYVQFREKKTTVNNENCYNISNFVYQAIRMKQCNVPLEIKLLDLKKAHEMARHHNLHRFERSLFFQCGVKKMEIDIPKVRPELPQLDVTFIPLLITMIINPGCFWSILNDNATSEKLQLIEKKLNEHPLKKLSSFSNIPTIIAAPMEKDNSFIYRRATIEEFTSMSGELVDVFFIDHGYSSQVRLKDLREIDDVEISKIPCLALRCNLACLRPSSQINPYGRWSNISKSYFKTQIKGSQQIFGNIYSVVDSVINLELIAVDHNKKKLNINEDLIEKGYAVRKEESYLSNYNHELRTNSNSSMMMTEEKAFYEEEQYSKDHLLKYPELPKENDYDCNVKLHGPYSPLEIEMTQLTFVGKSKKINIELSSVNSVLLDEDPDQSRLLVAQSISQNQFNDNLTLRNTTFLPNIPGLTALLVLCFAPRMELRCNSRKTYYTGALCGLGPIGDTERAMFPDHDMEIKFDVEIFIDDINEINKLRYWINEGMQLHDDSDNDYEHIINCQNRLKRILLELRDRQRRPLNLLIDDDDYFSYKWNRYNKSLFLPSTKETIRKYDIYPLHKVLALLDMDEKTEEIFKNLSELEHIASQDVQKAKKTTTFCKLCEVEMFGVLELRGHLYSEQHLKNKETLNKKTKWN